MQHWHQSHSRRARHIWEATSHVPAPHSLTHTLCQGRQQITGQGSPGFLLEGWPKLECPVQRLCPPGSYDWEEEIFPFLQQIPKQPLLPLAVWKAQANVPCWWMHQFTRSPMLLRGMPLREVQHTHPPDDQVDHLVCRRCDELAKHVSAICVVQAQPIQWSQLGQTHVPMLHSTQTLISP